MGDKKDDRDKDERDDKDDEPDVFFGTGRDFLEWQRQIAKERRERKD